MFSPQIGGFEDLKREYDPDLLIENSFSDRLFVFFAASSAHAVTNRLTADAPPVVGESIGQ